VKYVFNSFVPARHQKLIRWPKNYGFDVPEGF